MKIFVRLFTVMIVLALSGTTIQSAYAQNPKQSKKHKKKYKKSMKPGDPYEKRIPKSRDHDRDGVPDLYDHCQHTPPKDERNYEVNSIGCPPDRDGDGIFDPDDACPDSAGVKENVGCPWEDRDKDGILDKDDVCPDKPGIKAFLGCPDTDGDGVQDRDDKCPEVPGLKSLKGCPREVEDTDGDGIKNEDDVCPLVPGVVENHGCPEIKPEEKEALKRAFDNLLFKTGSDVIEESSFSSLNGLASVLINNPHMHLHLEGHTDNVGDDHENLILSEKRAKAVRRYLIKKGVTAHRITSIGFGETKPVESNSSSEGRRKNRRVEMTLKY